MKDSDCHDPKMTAYCRDVRWLKDKFDSFELIHVPRWDNEAADTLAKMASGREPVPAGIFSSNQLQPSIHYGELGRVGSDLPPPVTKANSSSSRADPENAPAAFMVMAIDEDPVTRSDPQADWRAPYLNCLLREILPIDKTEARWLTHQAKPFVIVDGELYKKSASKILQRCIPIE